MGIDVVKWDEAMAFSRLRRRRIWRVIAWSAVGVLLLSSFFNHVRAQNFSGDDWNQFDSRRAEFLRAIDGESILVHEIASGIVVPVRVLGIASFNAQWDRRSIDRMNLLLHGRELILHLEPTQTRDANGRLLADVFIVDGKSIAGQIVGEGLALADRRMDYAFRGEVEAAEGEARRKKTGLWQSADWRSMPAWRAAWFEEKKRRFSE